jgi:uncharacterized protein YjbJ (UPF0337 family)
MNSDQIRGLWAQLRGRGKVAWGRASDDPDYVAEGSAQHLYGRLQQGFGDTKQLVQRSLRKLRMP